MNFGEVELAVASLNRALELGADEDVSDDLQYAENILKTMDKVKDKGGLVKRPVALEPGGSASLIAKNTDEVNAI